MPLTSKELAEIAVALHEGAPKLLEEAIGGQLVFSVGSGVPVSLPFGKDYYDLIGKAWYRGNDENHPASIAQAAVISSGPPTIDAEFIGQRYFDTNRGVWWRSHQVGNGAYDWRLNDTGDAGRLIHLEDFYYGEDFWDDAYGRARAHGSNAQAFKGWDWIMLPTTGGYVANPGIPFAAPLDLINNTHMVGTDGTYTLLNFAAIDPASLGAIQFFNDGFGFFHNIKLFNFRIGPVPDGVHIIYQDVNSGEHTRFDDIALSPGNFGISQPYDALVSGGGADTIDLHQAAYFRPDGVLVPPASNIDDAYNGRTITIYEGPGAGETKTIIDYTGSLRRATVDSPWSVVPVAGQSKYYLSSVNCSMNSNGHHMTGSSTGSTPFHHGSITCWQCNHGIHMGGPNQLVAARYDSINGDKNGWLVYVPVGQQYGSFRVDHFKCELSAQYDPDIPGTCQGIIHIENSKGQCHFEQVDYVVVGGPNILRTKTALIEVFDTTGGSGAGRSPVNIEQFSNSNQGIGQGWLYAYAEKYLSSGLEVTRTIRYGDFETIMRRLDRQDFPILAIGRRPYDYGIELSEEHSYIGPENNSAWDFTGDVGAVPDTGWWETAVGSDPQCDVSQKLVNTSYPDPRGRVVLTPGNAGGLTPALNGVMITGKHLAFRPPPAASPYPGGTVEVSFLLRVNNPSGASFVRLFVGMVDVLASAGVIMPYTAIAGVVDDDPSIADAVGLVLDSRADAGQRFLKVATKTGVIFSADEQIANNDFLNPDGTGHAVSYITKLITIRYSTSPSFYINDNYVGALSAAVDSAVYLTPCVAVDCGNVIYDQSVELDWIKIRQQNSRLAN